LEPDVLILFNEIVSFSKLLTMKDKVMDSICLNFMNLQS